MAWCGVAGRSSSGGRFRVKETQVGYSPPKILTMLTISDITAQDFTTYRCNASINNDKAREKSLAVQLSGERGGRRGKGREGKGRGREGKSVYVCRY